MSGGFSSPAEVLDHRNVLNIILGVNREMTAVG